MAVSLGLCPGNCSPCLPCLALLPLSEEPSTLSLWSVLPWESSLLCSLSVRWHLSKDARVPPPKPAAPAQQAVAPSSPLIKMRLSFSRQQNLEAHRAHAACSALSAPCWRDQDDFRVYSAQNPVSPRLAVTARCPWQWHERVGYHQAVSNGLVCHAVKSWATWEQQAYGAPLCLRVDYIWALYVGFQISQRASAGFSCYRS